MDEFDEQLHVSEFDEVQEACEDALQPHPMDHEEVMGQESMLLWLQREYSKLLRRECAVAESEENILKTQRPRRAQRQEGTSVS